jgi:O-methyltransferase
VNRIKFNASYNYFYRIVFYIYGLINNLLFPLRLSLNYYYEDNKILFFINNLIEQNVLLLTLRESIQLYECVKSSSKIKGDIAEVGVYKGGSAKLIAEFKNNKMLHLFDTFKGLPQVAKEETLINTGDMAASFESVRNFLGRYKKVKLYKGLFKETSQKIDKKTKFSFVHLDVDMYKSTNQCLEFFYPRMSKGGIILTHDYPYLGGVKKAFDEFFEDKTETIIKLSGNQALVVKT